MTKSDLVDSVASKTGLTKKDTSRTIDAILETIKEQRQGRERRSTCRLWQLRSEKKRSRVGRNPPKTMEEIRIPARNVPVFRQVKS